MSGQCFCAVMRTSGGLLFGPFYIYASSVHIYCFCYFGSVYGTLQPRPIRTVNRHLKLTVQSAAAGYLQAGSKTRSRYKSSKTRVKAKTTTNTVKPSVRLIGMYSVGYMYIQGESKK